MRLHIINSRGFTSQNEDMITQKRPSARSPEISTTLGYLACAEIAQCMRLH